MPTATAKMTKVNRAAMKKAAAPVQAFFRYKLPTWTGRVYAVEVDGEKHPVPGDEVNEFLTRTQAPVALALMLRNMPRGHKLPVQYQGKQIIITRG